MPSDDQNSGETALVSVADATADNWVDRFAPEGMRPYLRLMRADRPIGVWLLLWPCWWSVALAGTQRGDAYPDLWLLTLFAIGAIAMRGAGCTYNDLVDRDIDGKVARTRSRPLPNGDVTPRQAKVFMGSLCLVGLVVLLQFNLFAIGLGIASLGIVAVYPFMKRITSWPQAVLGLAFSWGALMGWAVIFGRLDVAPVLLYLAAVTWTIGYDTIYAHQDKDDDAMLGLGSTALAFGGQTKSWLMLFFGLTTLLLLAAGFHASAGPVYFVGVAFAGVHLAWQVITLDVDDADNCLVRFRANRDFGALVFAALVVDMAVNAIFGI